MCYVDMGLFDRNDYESLRRKYEWTILTYAPIICPQLSRSFFIGSDFMKFKFIEFFFRKFEFNDRPLFVLQMFP